MFLWFFLAETKNRTLEETAAVFDGEKALEKIRPPGRDVKFSDKQP